MNLPFFIYKKLKNNTDKSNISSRIIKIAKFSVFIGIFISLSAVSIGKGLQLSINETIYNITPDISISSYENNNRGIASEIIKESEVIIDEVNRLYPDIKLNFTLEKPSIITINNPFFIAEISSNHNGNIHNAKRLIKMAQKNGADAVKLQTYTPGSMTINSRKKYFMIKKLKVLINL